jgi:hypothetical protein
MMKFNVMVNLAEGNIFLLWPVRLLVSVYVMVLKLNIIVTRAEITSQ